MAIRIANLDSIPVLDLPGRKLQWLVTPETLGTVTCRWPSWTARAGSVVRPLHSHTDTEEVIFILEGEGEALVDGEVAAFREGDAVFFPANSRHMVRNTGDDATAHVLDLRPATTSDSYELYEDEGW